ncbi:kinase [Thraustotheca clavata]|uniref:Kinase n=1 Tax=Thraustotheca clavata TaxID=74557 RepID=A0A1V9Y8B9_9STRA|nr:kinase [Thraustotheca clavata]
MLRLTLAGVVAGLVVAATCPYSALPEGSILVGDSNCPSTATKVCGVDNKCAVTVTNLSSEYTQFWGFTSVGDLSSYTQTQLTILNTTSVNIANMKLPTTVDTLIFQNVQNLDMTQTNNMFPDSLTTLDFINCNLGVIPVNFKWPSKLTMVILRDNQLQTIPKSLPSSLRTLAIQGNALTDLNYLPSSITFLNLDTNKITKIVSVDWRALTFLRLSFNTIATFAYVQLSTKLTYFNCDNCAITNFTINADTYAALNALAPWDGNTSNLVGYTLNRAVTTDATVCQSIDGTIQKLWATTSPKSISVCVVSSSPPSTTSVPTTLTPTTDAPASSSTNVGMIVGIAVGVVGVIGIIIAIILLRRKNHQPPQTFTSYQPYHYSPQSTNNAVVYTDGFGKTGTSGTGGPTVGTGGSGSADSEVFLDVSKLRQHRLELADLQVVSTKPLASGAYGEVWLGLYGAEQVAIKRVKDRRPASVQKFIDEIMLMSQMESDYVVAFVGASWRRPIEMECVVEYMDLGDLRNYLANTPPAKYSWIDKYASILSIVRGLIYLHTFNPPIIHRDLKSRNVLLDSKKGTKLTDFGASREVSDANMTNGIGTYQWMAPEVIGGTEYSIAADIYSFGIILSEFCTHQIPYSDMRHPKTGRVLNQQFVLSEVRDGKIHPTFEGLNVPSWVAEVGLQCLLLNPADRPTALQLSSILYRFKP